MIMYVFFDQEVPTLQVHPRGASAHNCLGPALGRKWNTNVSFDVLNPLKKFTKNQEASYKFRLGLPCQIDFMYTGLIK